MFRDAVTGNLLFTTRTSDKIGIGTNFLAFRELSQNKPQGMLSGVGILGMDVTSNAWSSFKELI